MQFKSFAALLFAGMAIAAPADNKLESRDDADSDFDIPNSIAVVIATAVPSSFWAEATNTAAFLSQVEEGFLSNSWPSWYSSLPDNVKEYVTTAVEGYYPSFASSISAEATSSGASGSDASSSQATATGSSSSDSTTGSTSASGSTSGVTDSSTSASPTGSDASSSASGSATSSTSDGGAAPTGVAMSLAGAAGVLGLALAL